MAKENDMDEHYLANETYDALVGKVMDTIKPLVVIPDRVQEMMIEDQIKIALGEVGDIWPASISVDRNE